jgi:hypothetical protein
MQIIPSKEPGSYSMQITLTGTIFLLNFYWNAINQYWLMDILNGNNEPIVYGIKIVPNYNLTSQFVESGMPQGDIVCQNVLNQWGDIGRFDMGDTTELVYYEPKEFVQQTTGT